MIPIVRMSLLESARRQVHLILLFLAVMLLVEPSVINAFNMALPERIVKDIGLTLMGLYGVGLSLFLSCAAVPGEIERHTIYPVMARPISRLHYLIAKFLSVAIVLVVSQLILCTCVDFSLWVFMKHGDPRLYIATLAMIAEDLVLAAMGVMFSTVASPVLAAVAGVFVYVVGGLSPSFINFFLSDQSSRTTGLLARGLKMFMPQFDFFQIKDAVVHEEPLSHTFLVVLLVYCLVWVFVLMTTAGLLFERRDL